MRDVMYFVEVVKKLKVAVAMVALSAMIPQVGFVRAESPAVAVISKESLERRLAVIVQHSVRIEQLELQFKAWSESTKPEEGAEPSAEHKKINEDLAEVQKQKNNLDNFIHFLSRKIKSHMSTGELAIADDFMGKVEQAIVNLNLPQLPEGSPGVRPVIVEKVETEILPPIAATEEERREFERRARENDAALILPEGGSEDKVVVAPERVDTVDRAKVVDTVVEEEKKVVVAEDEASRRARIAADVAKRLKLMEEKGAGIAPVDDSLMYNGKPVKNDVVVADAVVEKAIVREPSERTDERALVTTTTVDRVEGSDDKAIVVAADENVVVSPVVTDDEKVVVVAPTDGVVEKTEEFTVTVTEPRADGTERVVAKNNLGVGFDPEKVQYVELNCAGALIVKREANGASASIDDISCKNEKNRPTKVLILGFKDGHYKVFVNGFIGWISAVKTSEPKEVGEVDEEDTTIVVKPQDGQLNCDTRLMHRTGPTTEYRVLQKIPCKSGGRPTPVKIIGKHNQTGWYLVSHNGTIAWSSNRYINASEPNNLQIVTNDLLQGLSQVPDLGDLGIKCDPNGNQNDDPNCMRFQADFYTKGDSAKLMAAAINRAKQRGTNAKKAQFFELFAPIAVYLQTKTGWPASVTLAQMAIETSWGTSSVFRNLNNFGGHSCTRYSANGSRAIRNQNLVNAANDPGLGLAGLYKTGGGSSRIRTPCTYPRPRREGHYYREFPSVADASLLYADNVLESGYYPDAANHVKQRFSQGRSADPSTVVRGLRAYAADSGYRTDLMSIIRSNDLTRFDSIKSCPLSSRN